jgi:hypothetical protein
MINDPDLENNPMFKENEKFGKALDELTSRIVKPCVDYAINHGDDDEGWAHTILISMARATCKMLYSMQHTSTEEGKDIYEFYHDELLPLCKEIAYRESDEMMKAAERMEHEAEEKEEDGISFDRKKDVVLAIADPDMSVDDIIDKFFQKDMTGEQRKMVADHIAKVRVEKADQLQIVRERDACVNCAKRE